MKVHLSFSTKECYVWREKGDPKFRDSGWGSGESRLLYHVQQILKKEGHDLIKKRMHKDGHMYGDEKMQYLRTRSPKSARPHIYIYDAEWQLRNSATDFNENGEVTFRMETEVFDAT